MKETEIYNTPKDFFMYLLSVITLYIFFCSLMSLLFKFVNHAYPEGNLLDTLGSIRWHITTLMITFPVFIFTLTSIRKDYSHSPEKRSLKIRKWLLYFTLFLAALITMIDLGTLLFYFLGGDVTQRFLWKAVILLISTIALFYFYLRELHQGWNGKQIMVWLGALITVVVLTVVYGFYLIGTPSSARKLQMDEKKVNHLRQIQYHIIEYRTQKKQLPPSLDSLTNALTGYKAPSDPVTHKPYGYTVLSKNSFKICAQFELPYSKNDAKNVSSTPNYFGESSTLNWNWSHPAGYYCFTRTIDPELYNKK